MLLLFYQGAGGAAPPAVLRKQNHDGQGRPPNLHIPVVLPRVVVPPPPPLSSAIAFYRCEEPTGDRLDATGYGNTLSETALPVLSAAGIIGTAALVNASNGRLTRAAVLTSGPFTYAGWFYQTTNDGGSNDLFGQGDAFGTLNHSIGSDGIAGFPGLGVTFVARDTTSGVLSPGRYAFNAWHHVAATSDGSTLSLYVNGALVNSTPSVPSYTGITNLGVGFTPSALIFRADLLGVWPRALSLAEIQLLYNGGAGLDWSP